MKKIETRFFRLSIGRNRMGEFGILLWLSPTNEIPLVVGDEVHRLPADTTVREIADAVHGELIRRQRRNGLW